MEKTLAVMLPLCLFSLAGCAVLQHTALFRSDPAKSIAIPQDALAAKPESLKELLRKVGLLAGQYDRAVEITALPEDIDYLHKSVARGAYDSGKVVKITTLPINDRAHSM